MLPILEQDKSISSLFEESLSDVSVLKTKKNQKQNKISDQNQKINLYTQKRKFQIRSIYINKNGKSSEQKFIQNLLKEKKHIQQDVVNHDIQLQEYLINLKKKFKENQNKMTSFTSNNLQTLKNCEQRRKSLKNFIKQNLKTQTFHEKQQQKKKKEKQSINPKQKIEIIKIESIRRQKTNLDQDLNNYKKVFGEINQKTNNKVCELLKKTITFPQLKKIFFKKNTCKETIKTEQRQNFVKQSNKSNTNLKKQSQKNIQQCRNSLKIYIKRMQQQILKTNGLKSLK